MSVLILAEHDNTELKRVTLQAVSAAAQIDHDLHILVAGQDCGNVAAAAAAVAGVSKVLVVNDPAYAHQLAENLAQLLVELAPGYSHILAPATANGKNVMPRAAALLDVAQLSDVVAIEGSDTFVRPIYAGNAMMKVRSGDPVKVVTVRSTAFPVAATGGVPAPIESLAISSDAGLSIFVGAELTATDRPELTSARVVVAGGRGLSNGEDFRLVEEIADLLGAAVGASRPLVDDGVVPNDYQVGQTGKIVAPELYIAIGISGAVQHLAGMKDSKTIVAINNDEDAPIFGVADYGIVDDLFKVIPEMKLELETHFRPKRD